MYKLAKNVHKEKGLLYKKLSILRFFFFFFFFLCHTAKKCYLCRVINEIYLCLGLSNGIFLCCLPLWLSFVIWQWLTMWGTWVRCLLSSEIVDCTDKPSSLHVYKSRTWGSIFCVPFSSLSSRIRRIIFCSMDRWELLCLWQAGKVILSHSNLIGLTDSFEYR